MIVRSATDLGALIRDRRKALGLDQGELAERAEVSRLWINEVEQGKRNAGIGRLLRTLAVLDLALSAGPVDATRPRRSRASAIIAALEQKRET